MNELSNAHVINLQYELEILLSKRKNLMIYDGLRDGLDKNISTKFFYSSPYEPLEFISIDIFKSWEYLSQGPVTKRIFGSIYIIRDRISRSDGICSDAYGFVEFKKVLIRDVPKSKIIFHIGDKGIANIQDLVKHFELNYCIKGCSW